MITHEWTACYAWGFPARFFCPSCKDAASNFKEVVSTEKLDKGNICDKCGVTVREFLEVKEAA